MQAFDGKVRVSFADGCRIWDDETDLRPTAHAVVLPFGHHDGSYLLTNASQHGWKIQSTRFCVLIGIGKPRLLFLIE